VSFERRPLGNEAFALVSTTLEDEGFLAAFSERGGGVSENEFASLNLSYSSGDDPAKISANRTHVIEALGIPPFALGGQVHGAKLANVGRSKAGSGYDGPEGVLSGHDGLHTTARGVPVAVATADCVPVILASAAEGRVAAIHAGWKGVAAGIVTGATALFKDPKGVTAAIGPAAGPCHYEVGEDVAFAVSAAVPGGAVVESRDGSLFLDLPGSIESALNSAGVEAVEVARLCTIHEAGRFFSHRRDGPGGRQMAIAMRVARR
jgi:YfiH family protein